MPGKHHATGLIDRLPPRLLTIIGGGLAVAFVLGMVLLVQSRRADTPGSDSLLVEPPRSAAVISSATAPSRTVSSPPVSAPPPSRVVGVESATRPPAAPTRAVPPAPAPQPPRATAATTAVPPRPESTTIAATYAVGSSWDTGFIGSIEVRNTADAAQTWSVTVRHADSAGVRVVSAWNATLTRQGDTNVFTGGPLAPGATVRLGFEATKQVTARVTPTGCVAERGTCRVS